MATKRKSTQPLDSAKRLRKVCFTQATKIAEDIEVNGQSWTKFQISIKLSLLETYLQKFDIQQTSIEEMGEEVDSDARYRFQEIYASLKEKLLLLQSKFTDSGINLSSVTPIESSACSSRVRTLLPAVTLPKFDGSYSKWTDFINMFQVLINDKRELSHIEKFQMLRSCLTGIASTVIDSLECNEGNYQKALDLLKQRFDNRRLIFSSHINKLINLPSASKSSVQNLRHLVDRVKVEIRALQSLGSNEQIADAILINIISSKLDQATRSKWEESAPFNRIPKWSEFIDFVQNRCQTLEYIQNTPCQSSELCNTSRKRDVTTRFSMSVCTRGNRNRCVFCQSTTEHALHRCPKYLGLSIKERYKVAKDLKLCLNCLKKGHTLRLCTSSSCLLCARRHHTSLHFKDSNSATEELGQTKNSEQILTANQQSTSNCLMSSSFSTPTNEVILATALVTIISSTGMCTTCRVLLDSASQSNFITEKVVQQLNLTRIRTNVNIVGINSLQSTIKYKANLIVCSKHNDFKLNIDALILPKIVSEQPSTLIDIADWDIPKNISLADPYFNQPARVDVLLGAESFMNLLCIGQIGLGTDRPTLQKTVLGWVVSGKTEIRNPINKVSTGRTSLVNIEEGDNVRIDVLMKRFWEIEEVQSDIRPLSAEERHCEEHFRQNTYRTQEGRFVVRLPFKNTPKMLGNSLDTAKIRFLHLQKRLLKNRQLQQQYEQFMKEYEDLNHMEPLSNIPSGSNMYFMPHHGGEQTNSNSTKLRVVFDASCKTSSGTSLNDILMTGPKVQNDLFSVLCRFRTFRFVLSADIVKMYRQICIHPEDEMFQLILWNNGSSDSIKAYKLKTVTYGTACAPYLAIRCLKQLSLEHKQQYPLGAEALEKDLYVDDILTGAHSLEELKNLQGQLISILGEAGMELHKWCSNASEILSGIETERHQKLISARENESIRALGINWQPREDKFLFSFKTIKISKRVTKRSILSVIASFFDPLGLINPVIVLAKIFMQELWKHGLEWDESLPANLHTRWEEFVEQMQCLHDIRVDRYALSPGQLQVQIHGFSDASQSAYGACIFLRTINQFDNVHTKLLCAKSKVAPLKTVSIARLELCAALLLAELLDKVVSSLSTTFSNIYCWTDSSITLAWINATPSTWSTFVSHRVSRIQIITEKYSVTWKHVRSNDNPADILSHGSLPKNLVDNELWFTGPPFLRFSQECWPSFQIVQTTDEEKRKQKYTFTLTLKTDMVSTSKYINSFQIIRRVFSYANLFLKNCRSSVKKKLKKNQNNILQLDTNDLKNGEEMIIKLIQNTAYHNELKALKKGERIGKQSKILPLTPFLDNQGIIRVGGRLQNSTLQYTTKHPILLPHDHPFTRALVHDIHNTNMHVGLLTLNTIMRQKFWIPNSRQLIRSVIHQCLICYRSKPIVMQQIMGQLPENRVRPTFPFLHSGVDYCGPFMVKQPGRGRQPIKVYIALFICLASKAVHIELVSDLSTEAFIAALKRFTARRGKCASIISDNATNFVGAKRELNELKSLLYSQQHNDQISRFCSEQEMEWKFIPPRSPHFGGLWEAAIKKAKYHLSRTLQNITLKYEEFNTVVAQIEGILNSRPLTPLSSDPNDLEALTPSHFLIGRPIQMIPEPDVTEIAINRLSRWQLISRLQQLFWKRWSKEYLLTLQERNKWCHENKNTQIGTMVLLVDEQIPPSKWALGRVENVIRGHDGNTRVVDVRTTKGSFRRAIQKICVLPIEDNNQSFEVPSRRGVC